MRIIETVALLGAANAELQRDAAAKASRNLRETLQTESARACRSNCIDQGLYFCVTEDYQSGVCCDSIDEDCRQGEGLCSWDLPDDSPYTST